MVIKTAIFHGGQFDGQRGNLELSNGELRPINSDNPSRVPDTLSSYMQMNDCRCGIVADLHLFWPGHSPEES